MSISSKTAHLFSKCNKAGYPLSLADACLWPTYLQTLSQAGSASW